MLLGLYFRLPGHLISVLLLQCSSVLEGEKKNYGKTKVFITKEKRKNGNSITNINEN